MAVAARRPVLRLIETPGPLPPGRPSAVLVTLWPPVDAAGPSAHWRLLLIRRSGGTAAHAGQMAFPGGALEAHDPTVAACALREADEEIGLGGDAVEVAGYLPAVAIPVSGFAVQPVVAFVRDGQRPEALRPGPAEVAEVLLYSLGELAAAASWERRPPQSLRQGAWPVFALPGGRLWGATAIMVKSLLRRWHPEADRR